MIVDIQSLKEYLDHYNIDGESILSIMSVIRNELEDKKLKNEFRYLNMFCDWCLHPKLSRTMLSIDIMQEFISALCINNDLQITSPRKFNIAIIDKLFKDIRDLFKIIGIDCSFISNEKVVANTFYCILNVIKERQLVIDEKYILQNTTRNKRYEDFKRFCNNIFQKDGFNLTPKSLSVIIGDNGYLFWKLELLSPTDICFQIDYGKYNFAILKG